MNTLQNDNELINRLMAAAEKIGKQAEQDADEAEKKGDVSKRAIEILKEEQIHRLMLPPKYGGPQINLTTYAQFCRKVGYYNVSAAWLTFLYTIHNVTVSYLPLEGIDEIVQSGGLVADSLAPVGKAEKADGGYRISGKWHYTSGVLHSDWVAVGVMAQYPDSTEPEWCVGFLKTSELEILNDWDTFGLRGTGSNSIIADNVFVPLKRMMRFGKMRKANRPIEQDYDKDYYYYRVPFTGITSIGFALVALGGAERIIAELKKYNENRQRLFINTKGSETPQAQRALAEIAVDFHAADALMDKYIRLCENYENVKTTQAEFSAIRSKIIKLCADIAAKSFPNFGGSILANSNPVQRFIKDVLSVSTHKFALYEDALQGYGRELFGLESGAV